MDNSSEDHKRKNTKRDISTCSSYHEKPKLHFFLNN